MVAPFNKQRTIEPKTLLVMAVVCGLFLSTPSLMAQPSLALAKYRGGGDWYANPSALTNLIAFCRNEQGMRLQKDYATVDIGSNDLFKYPWIHLTGHGNIVLSPLEAEQLRKYLSGGGFLHADDNYGLAPYFLKAMKLVFPEIQAQELGAQHPIFQKPYPFPKGLPKIHEHDNKRPEALAWIYQGRLVCLFTYECDLSDGWEDPEVHRDSEAQRLKALQMGANILDFVFTQ